jgi:hypothetical protein
MAVSEAVQTYRAGAATLAADGREEPEGDAEAEIPGKATRDTTKESSRHAPVSAFQSQNDQFLSAIKWLIGALAAIAAVLVAGTELPNVGLLTWPEDEARMRAAGLSFALVLGCVVIAIGLLAWVQMPGQGTDIERLRKIVEVGKPKAVLQSVECDSSYHRGAGSLASLLESLDSASAEHYEAKHNALVARLVQAGDETETLTPPLTPEDAAQRSAVRTAFYANLRHGVRLTSQLDQHLRMRRRAKVVTWIVLALTLLSALSLIVFVWAANPPEPPTSEDAVPPRAVAATLVLTSTDAVWADRLGESCAEAARGDSGVPVVALSADDDGVQVLTVPGADCPEPVRVLVPAEDGIVVADEQVDPAG